MRKLRAMLRWLTELAVLPEAYREDLRSTLNFDDDGIAIGCSAYLTIKHGMPRPLKIIMCVLSTILILPVGFMGFISLIFGNIGQNTVVQAVESPNGVYYAEVIDSDQGALGGDTLVEVYENAEINLLVFRIFKNPQRVYHGEWGEFEDMDVYWKDDQCLVINSVEHPIE